MNAKSAPRKAKASRTAISSESPVTIARGVAPLTREQLAAASAGRCEFPSCNKPLYEHGLTKKDGNFGQAAHIVAFSEGGPRGGINRPEALGINNAHNLMMLCPEDHKLIDDRPHEYSVDMLREWKQIHEDRIRLVSGLGPDLRTTVVQLKTNVAGQAVGIPAPQIYEAVVPHYPTDTKGIVIDLTSIPGEGDDFYSVATRRIRRDVTNLFAEGMEVLETRHISLFALAPIPLLMFLGNALGNKVQVDLYQRHRDTEDWIWKTTGIPARHEIRTFSEGSDSSRVALIMSLSGSVAREKLPSSIDETFTIYEIALASSEPSLTYLQRRADLNDFANVYREAFAQIRAKHQGLREIHVFAAIPAPVAVACGRELLPKVDPVLLVYDFDKVVGFRLRQRVNEYTHE